MSDAPTLTEDQLQALVRRAQEGDTAAFGEVYDHFFPSVYRYASFRLPPEAAEDTVADIFVKAWEKLDSYKTHRGVPFAAWLFRIARHAVIDVYRTQRGYEEIPETIEDTDAFNQAEHGTVRRDRIRIVREAMDKLPRRYREILLLTFVSELPHSAVAQLLRTSEGSVRILKMRALRKLEEFLPPDLGFPT